MSAGVATGAASTAVEWPQSATRVRALTPRRIWLLWVFVALAYAGFVHFWPNAHTANEAARLYLSQAIVDHGTIALDPIQDRYGQAMGDAVLFGARRYLDKAPGLPLAMTPVYAIATRGLGMSTERPALPWVYWLMLLFGIVLPLCAAFEALRRVLSGWLSDPSAASWALLTLALASPLGIYATLYFGHACAAAFAMATLVAAHRSPTLSHGLLPAGILGGIMVFVDTVTAPLALMLVLYGVGRRLLTTSSARAELLVTSIIEAASGALPFIVLQFAYNDALFGNPFTFAYRFKTVARFEEIHSQGLYGISLPSLEALYGLLISPTRGLFFHAPVLVLGIPGLWRRDHGPEPRWLLAVFGIYALWISGFVEWRAGQCYGPRHLMPIVPLLAVGLALELSRRPGRLWSLSAAGLAAYSALMTLLPNLTWPYPAEDFGAPVTQLAWPLLLDGQLAPTVFGALGAPAALVVALIAVLWLAPVVVLRPSKRALLAGFGGVALFGLTLVLTPEPTYYGSLRRARTRCLMGDAPAGEADCRASGGTPEPGSCMCAPDEATRASRGHE